MPAGTVVSVSGTYTMYYMCEPFYYTSEPSEVWVPLAHLTWNYSFTATSKMLNNVLSWTVDPGTGKHNIAEKKDFVTSSDFPQWTSVKKP